MTIPKTIGDTACDDADDEDDEGFLMVGDAEEVPSDKVLITIPAEKVAKPEDSSFDEKGKMFESEEDDDAEVQEQIKAILVESGPLDELQMLESEDDSKSETPDNGDDEEDLD